MLSEERSVLHQQMLDLREIWFMFNRVLGSKPYHFGNTLSRTHALRSSARLRYFNSDGLFEVLISMLSGNDDLVLRLRMIRYEGSDTVRPLHYEGNQRVFYLYNADLELFTHEEKCAVKAAMMVLMDKVKDQIKDILQQMFWSDDYQDVVASVKDSKKFPHLAPQVTWDMWKHIKTHKKLSWVRAFKGDSYRQSLSFIVQGMNQSGLRKVDTSA